MPDDFDAQLQASATNLYRKIYNVSTHPCPHPEICEGQEPSAGRCMVHMARQMIAWFTASTDA